MVEHCTGIAEVTGSNPAEAWIFFRLLFRNCLNCVSTAKIFHNVIKLRSVNSVAFRNDVMTSALFTSPARNVEDLCSQYDHELLKIVDSHAPLKTHMVTSWLSAPWYTEEIAIEKCKRRQQERHWRNSGLEADKQQFADQCKQVRELIKSTKVNHYSSLIMENKSDHKVLFHSINCLLHRIPEKHCPICGSTNELCDKFADFFSEKILKVRHQLDAL